MFSLSSLKNNQKQTKVKLSNRPILGGLINSEFNR